MDEEIQKLLKDILPELEQELRKQLKKEYDSKLKEIQKYYQSEVQRLITKKEQEIREIYEGKLKQQNNHIFKKVASLQAQRRDWLQMELSYQKTIKELTNQVINMDQKSQKPENQAFECEIKDHSEPDSLNNSFQKSQMLREMSGIVTPGPPLLSQNLSSKVSKWKKKESKNELNKYFDMPRKVEKEVIEQEKQSYNEKQVEDTSILGPPVIENEGSKKSIRKSKNMFWNEEKKKQLLQMIKLK